MIERIEPAVSVPQTPALRGSQAAARRGGAAHGVQGGRRPPVALVLPGLLIAAAIALPLVYLLVRAAGADVRTWASVLRPRTLQVLLQTVVLTAGVAAGATALGVPLAWLTARTDLRWRRFWTISTVLPLAIPSYLSAFAFVAALGPRGLVQGWLEPLGVERLPEIYGFGGALLVLILVTYPYVLVSVRAALRGLDSSQEEAARSMGDSTWRVWWRITLPQLRPSIVAGGLLAALYALSDFGVVSLLQYDSLTRAIYLGYQASFNRTPAAILGLLLVALTALLIGGEMRARGRACYYRVSPGAGREARTVRLGQWQWAALPACALVVVLAAGVPLGVVGYWSVLAVRNGEPWTGASTAAFNTVYVAILAALAVTVASALIALLIVRYGGRLGRFFERMTYLGHALPGIVIALALVFWAARYAAPIYQTLPLLVLAYLVRFLPQGVGAARSALLQVDPRVEEAARSLGRSSWSTLWTITLPLVRPGLFGGAVLVALTTMKELPATLLLSPIGFETLATEVWSATGEAFFGRAAWPALLLVVLAVLPTALLTVHDRRHDV